MPPYGAMPMPGMPMQPGMHMQPGMVAVPVQQRLDFEGLREQAAGLIHDKEIKVRSPQRCALAWQVKKQRSVRRDRAWACPSTSTIRRRRCWRACSARWLHASLATPGDGDPFGYGWEQCSMLVELCECLQSVMHLTCHPRR